MFTNDLVDTSIPGEVGESRSPRSARLSSEGVKLDGLLYHSSVQLVKEIMNRSPAKRDRASEQSRGEERYLNRTGKEEDGGTLDHTRETDALERARRRIAAWPKRHRTTQTTGNDTNEETTQNSRLWYTRDSSSHVFIPEEKPEHFPLEYEAGNQTSNTADASLSAVNPSSRALDHTPAPAPKEPSPSSSSAFRRRFTQIQNESPGRGSWTQEQSGEGRSRTYRRDGRGVLDGRDVGQEEEAADAPRTSDEKTPDGYGESQADLVPPSPSYRLNLSETRNEQSAGLKTAVTDNDGTRSQIAFSGRSHTRNSSIHNSRNHDSTSSLGHHVSPPPDASRVAPPTPEPTSHANGLPPTAAAAAVAAAVEGKPSNSEPSSMAGIDMSFSHVEHSTPLRPAPAPSSSLSRGAMMGTGVRALLGLSSEEDDTVDSTVSSSPPPPVVRMTAMRLTDEAKRDDVRRSGKGREKQEETSWRSGREGMGRGMAESIQLRDDAERREKASSPPPVVATAPSDAAQRETTISYTSFVRSPLSRRTDRSVSQEGPQAGSGALSVSGEASRDEAAPLDRSSTPDSKGRGGGVSGPGTPRWRETVGETLSTREDTGRIEALSREGGTIPDQEDDEPLSTHFATPESALYTAEEAPLVLDTQHNPSQNSTLPRPTATTPVNAAVAASPQAQRLARAVTQEVMTWYEQEVVRAQEQEAATRAREEAEAVLRRRVKFRGSEGEREREKRASGARLWARWWWVVYMTLLLISSAIGSMSSAHTVISPSDEFYYSATTGGVPPWDTTSRTTPERLCRWASGWVFGDADEQTVAARCGHRGLLVPRRRRFRVPV